jgi:hyperosmotically inducible protein
MKNSWKTTGLAAFLAAFLAVGCAGNENSRSTGTYIDDTAVSAKVKTELLTDKRVKGTEVAVRTYNGEVQLSGFVDSPDQKVRAVQVARAVPGVRDVHDDLIVKVVPATAAVSGQPIQEAAGAQTQPASGQ